MGHIPDNDNFDEYLNASAEEWSKPETPPPAKAESESTDRWGASIPDPTVSDDAGRWGSEPMEPTRAEYERPAKKSGSKWWIILIVVVVVLCLCLCVALIGLPALGFNLFQGNLFP